jgi:hypothetical protein
MEGIIWTDLVINAEELQIVKWDRNVVKNEKEILHGNCLLKRIIEGKIQGRLYVMGRQRRRCKKKMDDCKGIRSYCELKEEALVLGTGF